MKSPISDKEMTLMKTKKVLVFRGEEYGYFHSYYYCEDSGESFTNTELDELNLTQVYNHYRDRHNLPFTHEIIQLRDLYQVSASKMSQILGFGINGYKNYEKGEIPNQTHGNLIQSIIKDPSVFKNLVNLNNDLHKGEKETLIERSKKIKDEITKHKYWTKHILGDILPNPLTGFRKPDMERIKNMVLFFSNSQKPVVTKLNKLMFYADFINYRKTGYSISGLQYMAHNYGPTPKRFRTLYDYFIDQEYINSVPINFGEGYVGEFYEPGTAYDFNEEIFSDKELNTLSYVDQHFRDCSATDIMNTSHKEKAWLENEKDKNYINYEYGFELISI